MITTGTHIGRVDIHSHVLPHIDDGARDMDEALEMLRMASADGTGTIVATPHGAQVTPERIRYATEALQLAARTAGIDIAILNGCEVKFSANLAEDYRAGKLMTINEDSYMLVEFSFSRAWTSMLHTSLYALQMAGVTPIVAHAERYPAVHESPSALLEMVAMGIPIQINASSLLGQDGEQDQRTAELLLQAGMVHILASDGHRRDKRMPLLTEGYARIAELLGPQQAERMQLNATRVISGRTINLPEPDAGALKPPSRLQRMFKRIGR